ncbi:MAG: gluconate 2-dehydrogenase subunit 3 family protein, partial [Gemmatimonadaceae bacterium]
DRPDGAPATRRSFLKFAGAVAATAAATGAVSCKPAAGDTAAASATSHLSSGTPHVTGFDRATLDAVGDVVLPASLGAAARRAAVTAFVAWSDGYEPVAEEMHGYGYADVRYLPSDPAPAWRAQLEGLDLLAKKMQHKPFAQLDETARREVLTAALAYVPGGRLPSPLGASHVAVAILSHWAATPDAWNLALGVQVSPNACRRLDGVMSKPLPIAKVQA